MKNRISLITALAVGATVVAGSAAIAANVGVLTSADSDSIGNLSAETPVETPPTADSGTAEDVQVVDVYLEDPVVATTDAPADTADAATVPATTAPGPEIREFAVEAAGIVSIEQRDDGLLVAEVDASEGWLWKTEQTSATEVRVTFASNDTIYEFVASVNDDGEIDADVEQPIVNVVQIPGSAPAPSGGGGGGGGGGGAAPATVPSAGGGAPPATAPSSSYDDDDHDEGYEDEGYEDESHEDESHEDESHEYESHEYEGGEDDD